jgi:hypothetical protein
MFSADAWIALNPAEAYPELAREHSSGGSWLLWRRPLLTALILGCAVSLVTSGRLTVRLVGPASLYGCFVPLLEVASLATVWRPGRQSVSFSRASDLFFASHGPIQLWLVAFSAIWAFVPPFQAFAWLGHLWVWAGSATLMLAWSGHSDYWFFRCVLERPPAAAMRGLVQQRLLCWSGIVLFFLASSAWETVASRMGL